MQKLLSIAVIVLLTSCMPVWITDYLEPSASEGALREMCAGPPEWIEFDRNHVKIWVNAARSNNPDNLLVSIYIFIPKGTSVEIPNKEVAALITGEGSRYAGILKYQSELTQEPLVGETIHMNPIIGERWDRSKDYMAFANINIPKSDHYELILPPFRINNISVSWPKIVLKKKTHMSVAVPINC